MLVNKQILICPARGNIKTEANLQAGDMVELQNIDGTNIITKLLPRKNSLTRPYISNLDQLIIVISPLPKPDLTLVDKLLIGCTIHNITPIIVVNKSDLSDDNWFLSIKEQFKQVVEHILFTSTKTGDGISEVKQLLSGKLSAFCGQSAVGKSSLINSLSQHTLNLKTDGLSKKINVGKNTTRDTQIFVFEHNTLIADTPGFNMLHYYEFEPASLKTYYPEFLPFANSCTYTNCNHVSESEELCAVKQAVNNNKINKSRYERYTQLYLKMKESWRKYD